MAVKTEAERASEQVHFWCTPAELRAWKRSAKANRMALSVWVRLKLNGQVSDAAATK